MSASPCEKHVAQSSEAVRRASPYVQGRLAVSLQLQRRRDWSDVNRAVIAIRDWNRTARYCSKAYVGVLVYPPRACFEEAQYEGSNKFRVLEETQGILASRLWCLALPTACAFIWCGRARWDEFARIEHSYTITRDGGGILG